MRRVNHSNFLLALLLNLMFNLEGTIPAWILLALHFIFGISIWWFVGALLLWLAGILLWMLILGWANRCSRPDPPKKNKNPYSNKRFPGQ